MPVMVGLHVLGLAREQGSQLLLSPKVPEFAVIQAENTSPAEHNSDMYGSFVLHLLAQAK